MPKIYIARKDLIGEAEHTYWVYDPDGNPTSGDERIIRGGTVVPGQFGGTYLIEADRAISQSRDVLNGDDPFTDRYYTTVFQSEDGSLTAQDVQDRWDDMVVAAKSVGIEKPDSYVSGTLAYELPENDYLVFSPNCNCLTSTVGDAVGVVAADTLPFIGGDSVGVERIPNNYGVMGIDSLLVGTGDNNISLNNNSNNLFDQGGEDTYSYDFTANGRPNRTITIVEDDIAGRFDHSKRKWKSSNLSSW